MKTRLLLIFPLIGFLLSSTLRADESGFISLFNGKDLSGWDAKPGCWEVRSGEIWCTGKSPDKNWLVWRKDQPADFILRLDFRWDNGNSGVQVRSDDLGEWMIYGYQVEIATQGKMGLWHHSLLDGDHPKKKERHLMATAGQHVVLTKSGEKTAIQAEEADKVKLHFKDHQWNSMEIIAQGDTLVQKVNDVVFSIVVDQDAEMSRKKGFIAFQDHGKNCQVAFRNIRIKKLP